MSAEETSLLKLRQEVRHAYDALSRAIKLADLVERPELAFELLGIVNAIEELFAEEALSLEDVWPNPT